MRNTPDRESGGFRAPARPSKRRFIVLLGMLLTLVGLTCGPVTAAGADPYDARHWSLISARHSGLCMDVAGGSPDAGAPIIQWGCHGGYNQQWDLVPAGNDSGAYFLVSAHTGQCLDVSGGSVSPGAQLIQWPCHGGRNQQFYVVGTSDGYVALIAVHSEQCVDVRGGSVDRGTPVIQWPCHFGGNQQWWIT